MSIVSIEETKEGKSASWSVSGGRTYGVDLKVTVDDPNTGPRAVILALGLNPTSTYRYPLTTTETETDPGSFLQSISVGGVDEDGLVYTVSLAFGPYDAGTEGGAVGTEITNWIVSPFAAPPTISWSSDESDWALTHDRDGKAIINTVGDPFDPGLTTPFSTPVCTITRVEKSFDPDWIMVFKNSTNDAAWLGFSTESVLCKDITASRSFDPDWGWLWTVVYTFAFRPSRVADGPSGEIVDPGWAIKVLNAGVRHKAPGGNIEPALVLGIPVSTPVPLAENGRYMPETDPFYLTFNTYSKTDFSLFGFPSDLFEVNTP